MSGCVYLTGAGPGDPGLLTVRGLEVIKAADVIVYDRLVQPELLKYARPGCELIYVGKAPSAHTKSQDEINDLLVDRASSGLLVCRLKGGDPFVFGRGGEEADACVKAGVHFEIIPGITSAISVPAYAGIPVTMRKVASSFAIVYGYENLGGSESPIESEHRIPDADTLVFLMGLSGLKLITDKLIGSGRDPATPAAVISRGTTKDQKVVVGTVGTIASVVDRLGILSPAITVVGNVVNLSSRLRWYQQRPLAGRRIVVTRASNQAAELVRLIGELGGTAIECPLIKLGEIPHNLAFDEFLRSSLGPGWVIFTSANGVEFAWQRMQELGLDSRFFGQSKIAAIGTSTAACLKSIGIRADFVPQTFNSEGLLDEWPDVEVSGKPVTLLTAAETRGLLIPKFIELGAVVKGIPVYQNMVVQENAAKLREMLRLGEADAVTFTSASCVKALFGTMDVSEPVPTADIKYFCLGPITASAASDYGCMDVVVSKQATIASLAEVLVTGWNVQVDD